jgi:hypothetical protein
MSLIIVNFSFWRQFLSGWIRIRIHILKPDPNLDAGGKLNSDPYGSGSKTLVETFWEMPK